jgi:two-component system response regulator MprA
MTQSTDQCVSILCVEPDAQARAAVEEALTGYHLVFAVNGYEALRVIDSRLFHAYVLEFWLPGWPGLQACRDIRRSDPRVPIVFCTSADRDEDRARALEAGASDYLHKPVDPSQLRRKLRVLLELAELHSKRAERDERLAIDDALRERAAEAMARTGLARLAAARAIESTAKTKALSQYLKAGGTLAHFEAAWGPSFSSAWARYAPLSHAASDMPETPSH